MTRRAYICGASLVRRRGHYFKPFSSEDEAQLTAVLTAKPRHVTRFIRQSMRHSRRRTAQFRNAVTYLMILLQSRLQKREIDPAEASVLIANLMQECVELHQGDMAHLLFRAAIRFRKYGVTMDFKFVKHLYDSYRYDNAKELMGSLANELRGEPTLRLLAVLAYQFHGDHHSAMRLLNEIPAEQLQTSDYCALLESFGVTARYTDIYAMVSKVMNDAVLSSRLDVSAVLSTGITAIRGDPELQAKLLQTALDRGVRLSEAALGAVVRVRLQQARISCVDDVYALERALKKELKVASLGMLAETALIGRCTEFMARSRDRGDGVMLQKIYHLKHVFDAAAESDRLDDVDLSCSLALIKGFGVLGRFDEMRECFCRLRDAGAIKDHRLYDEMLRWYAFASNVKDAIALKEEMTADHVFHTTQTYHSMFRVLDKYYPRLVEKYFCEMRGKGIQIEGFMYPTLIRIFGELQDMTTVESLYREAKAKAAHANAAAFSAGIVVQMLKCSRNDVGRCEALIHDAEAAGLLAHEGVQAEIVHFYAMHNQHNQVRAFLSRVPYRSQSLQRVLLQDAARRRDREAFDTLLKEMYESRAEVSERVFTVVITALSLFGDVEGVRRFVHRALASDKVRTPLFYADAAAAYARMGEAAAVDQCWRDMLDSKLSITMVVYNRFLDLYMEQNHLTMVQEILDTMMRLVPPNPVTATTVVDMLGKMGRLDEMEAVLDQMTRSANAAPTLVTYHHAMSAYAKAGEVLKMEKMRERLQQEGFKENHVTFNILFDGYGRAKRYEHLQELVAERRRKNIPMEEFGYTILLNNFSRARLASETTALVEEMATVGVPFSSRLLATIAHAFSFIGDVPQMERYVSLLLSHPNCRQRDIESVYMMYSRMRDTVKLQELFDTTELPRSELVYNICVSAFARAGEHAKVAYLLSQMEARGYGLSRNTTIILSSLLLKAGKLDLAQTVLKWKGMSPTELSNEKVPSVEEERGDAERAEGLLADPVNSESSH